MVGDIDDRGDLRYRFGDRDLDALPEGDGRHPTSLPAATEPQAGGGAFDADELGVSPRCVRVGVLSDGSFPSDLLTSGKPEPSIATSLPMAGVTARTRRVGDR